MFKCNLQSTWDNLHKYIRRNVKRTLDERIERKRAQVKVEGSKDVDTDSDVDGMFKLIGILHQMYGVTTI